MGRLVILNFRIEVNRASSKEGAQEGEHHIQFYEGFIEG